MAAHAVKQKDTVFVFKSAYEPGSEECLAMGRHLTDHGDGVKDVAFTVEDLDGIMAGARARGVSISIVSSDINIIWSPEITFGKPLLWLSLRQQTILRDGCKLKLRICYIIR